MPTYTYECVACGHTFDVFHAMSAEPKIKCEECKGKCQRLLGTGAGLIFKGSGFYETDYKDKKGKPPEKSKSNNGTAKKADKKAGSKSSDASATKPSASKKD